MATKYSNSAGSYNIKGLTNANKTAQQYLNQQAAERRAGPGSATAADYRIKQVDDIRNSVASAVALAGGPVPGNIPFAKPKSSAVATPKAKAKAPTQAVARRVGVPVARGPVAPPVDPLETLRGEYDKYLTDIYGGLNTSLEGIRNQYQTRSQELGTRLGQIYDDSKNVAGETATRTNEQMASFAASMGLGQALQGRDTADWQHTNERLKSLNEVNRANSLATNDTIRTNYYDFLGDKISSAKGQEAMSRGSLNDIIAQAKLARQQAAAAAAAAAARARSSRGRGGGSGGSGSVKGSTQEKVQSTNDELNALAMQYPAVMDAMIRQDTIANSLLKAGQSYHAPGPSFGPPGSVKNSYAQGVQIKRDAENLAKAYIIATGKTGGPKTSSTYTQSVKGVR